jgi:hypothetical protein
MYPANTTFCHTQVCLALHIATQGYLPEGGHLSCPSRTFWTNAVAK